MDQSRALCLATKDASKLLKRLDASGVGYKLLGCNGADAELLKNSLESLHRLRLGIELSSSDDQFLSDAETIQHPDEDIFGIAAHSFRQGGLRELLGSMPQLRVLRLSFPRPETAFEDEISAIIDLQDITGNLTWRNSGHRNLDDYYKGRRLGRLPPRARREVPAPFPLVDYAYGGRQEFSTHTYSWSLSTLARDQSTPEFSIDTPEVRQFSELLGDAIEDDIRAGGDLPDLDALQQQQIALEEIGEVPDDYVHNDEEDGGYDSDGSSISYGSDDFNKEI